ncbi:hypothetical protein BJX99DRAFT_268020 [Aspergillus californicus]
MARPVDHITRTFLLHCDLMELAGVAIGAVGLLGLYGLFQDAVTKLQSVKEFSSESSRLSHRYNADRILFEKWGKRVGIAGNHDMGSLDKSVHPDLRDEATISAVKGLITSICDVLTSADPTFARYQEKRPTDSDSAKLHLRSRLKWAVADIGKLSRQVNDFDALVQKLYLLVPPDKSQHDEFQKQKEGLIKSQRVQALEQLSHWLEKTTTEDTLDAHCTTRLNTTCGWILTHQTYQDWLSESTDRSSKVLWAHGPAGFGKSVLCAYIIKSLSTNSKYSVCYFFCSGDNESQKNPISILRSWIWQAIHQDDAVFDLVLQYLHGHDTTVATVSDLWELIKRIMSHNSNHIFIVDGLDECPRASTATVDLRRNREDLLHELLKVAANAKSRILILRPYGPQPPGIQLFDLGITKDHLAPDLAQFAEHIVSQKLPGKPDIFHQELGAQMVEKSDGILRPRQKKNLVRVYERDWKDIQAFSPSDRQRAETILRWVTFAQRPLTIAELSDAVEALDVDEEDGPQLDELPDPSDEEYVDTEIVGLCGSFLELRAANEDENPESRTVHLVHFSANEFLLGVHDGAVFSDYALQHSCITQLCLRYLDRHNTWHRMVEKDVHNIMNGPFTNYAVLQWHKHLEGSGSYRTELHSCLESFFDKKNPFWDKWRDQYEISSEAPGLTIIDIPTKIDSKPNSTPGERMYYAALFGLVELMQYLYTNGITDIDKPGGYHSSPLHAAAVRGNLDALTFLFHKGVDVEAKPRGYNAIHAILESGADPSTARNSGYSALGCAANEGNLEVAEPLIDSRADLTGGLFALHIAAQHGYLEVVKLLIDSGADPNATNADEVFALHLAALGGHYEVAELLIDSGADPNAADTHGVFALHLTASGGHYEVAKLLIDSGADPSTTDIDGAFALNIAAQHGYLEVVKLLVNSGADPDARTHEGWSPLMHAARTGRLEIVKMLLRSGGDISAENDFGCTPLFMASFGGHVETMQELLEAGADLAAVDRRGMTALHYAIWGTVESVEFLMEVGAAISATDHEGETALHIAANRAGAEVDAQSVNGITPLHNAFRYKHEDVIATLLEHKASFDLVDVFGLMPFQYSTAKYQANFQRQGYAFSNLAASEREQHIRKSGQTLNPYVLDALGRCLLLLKDSKSASVVFNKTVLCESGTVKPIHEVVCVKCRLWVVGERFACTECVRMNLCATCMTLYRNGGIPSSDWRVEGQTDVYTEEFVEWLKDLSLRNAVANL